MEGTCERLERMASGVLRVGVHKAYTHDGYSFSRYVRLAAGGGTYNIRVIPGPLLMRIGRMADSDCLVSPLRRR